jgi:hypothetical protein
LNKYLLEQYFKHPNPKFIILIKWKLNICNIYCHVGLGAECVHGLDCRNIFHSTQVFHGYGFRTIVWIFFSNFVRLGTVSFITPTLKSTFHKRYMFINTHSTSVKLLLVLFPYIIPSNTFFMTIFATVTWANCTQLYVRINYTALNKVPSQNA